MKKLIVSILFVVLLFSNVSMSESWTPNPRFTIEKSTKIDTLTFIAGISYALTYSNNMLLSQGKSNYFCMPAGSIVGSKILLDIANEKLSADHSSEEVIDVITKGLISSYPCKK